MGDPQQLSDVLACDPLLLTPEEAAKVLGVGRTTVYALMRDGELHPVHFGRSGRLSRAKLERYVSRLETPSPQSVTTPIDRAAINGSICWGRANPKIAARERGTPAATSRGRRRPHCPFAAQARWIRHAASVARPVLTDLYE
jgi:excisionase family DNA binding protein